MISDTAGSGHKKYDGRSRDVRTVLTVVWASMQNGSPWSPVEPLLTALCHADGSAAGPLQVLRMQRLGPSVIHIPAFSDTLRHLVLPDGQPDEAGDLPAAISHLTALEVHTLPQACMLLRTDFVCTNANAEAHTRSNDCFAAECSFTPFL